MIVLDHKQGSPAWLKARMGIPTASMFDRIMTPKTRKLSAQADSYLHELLSEWLTGVPHGIEAQGFVQRGTEMEAWAVSWYELQRDTPTKAVGLVLRDDWMVGCSPDRLVGEDGGLEIKCPSAAVHVGNLLQGIHAHYAQVQGGMWLTGRKWWDLLSYHPEIPPAIIRIERDEEFIADLDGALEHFIVKLQASREHLLSLGCRPADGVALPASAMSDPTPF